MNIAIYSRKSKLTERGESIKNQIEMCLNYAVTHFQAGEQDLFIYEDEGFSGGNTDRPELKRLMQDIARKKFDAIICYRLDRISRNVLDFSNILEVLNKANTSFVSITEHFDTTTPMGRAMVNIAAVFAQLERETIAERIRDNMRRLARTGRYLGSTPAFGFKAEKIEYIDANGNKKRMQKLTPVAEDMEFVKLVFDKFIELKGLTRVETWLMKSKQKNKNGNYMGTTEIRRMVSNPVYVKADESIYDYYESIGTEIINPREEFTGKHGMLLYGKHDRAGGSYHPEKWMVVLAKHNGVIDSDKFLTIQHLLDANKAKAPRAGTGHHGLLVSKLKCGVCGGTMSVIYIKNRDVHYYKCRNKEKSRKTLCDIKNIHGVELDEEICNYLKSLSENLEISYATLKKYRSKNERNEYSLKIDKSGIQRQITEKEAKIKNLTARLSENESSTAVKYIITDIEKLDAELKDLNSDLSLILNEKYTVNDFVFGEKATINLLSEFGLNFHALSFEEKRKLIDRIIDKIIWDGSDFEIYFR